MESTPQNQTSTADDEEPPKRPASVKLSPKQVVEDEDKNLENGENVDQRVEVNEKPIVQTPVDMVAEDNKYETGAGPPPELDTNVLNSIEDVLGDNDDVNIDAHEAKIREISPVKHNHDHDHEV